MVNEEGKNEYLYYFKRVGELIPRYVWPFLSIIKHCEKDNISMSVQFRGIKQRYERLYKLGNTDSDLAKQNFNRLVKDIHRWTESDDYIQAHRETIELLVSYYKGSYSGFLEECKVKYINDEFLLYKKGLTDADITLRVHITTTTELRVLAENRYLIKQGIEPKTNQIIDERVTSLTEKDLIDYERMIQASKQFSVNHREILKVIQQTQVQQWKVITKQWDEGRNSTR